MRFGRHADDWRYQAFLCRRGDSVDITSTIGVIVPARGMEVIIKSIEVMNNIFQIPVSKADMV